MLKKRLLTISFLLRLMAISTAAHAGSTITDKSYWPDEARQTAQSSSVSSQSDFNSSLAYDWRRIRTTVDPPDAITVGQNPRDVCMSVTFTGFLAGIVG